MRLILPYNFLISVFMHSSRMSQRIYHDSKHHHLQFIALDSDLNYTSKYQFFPAFNDVIKELAPPYYHK